MQLREDQMLPQGNWRIWLILAGRGFGKTTAAAANLRKLILEERIKFLACIGKNLRDATEIMAKELTKNMEHRHYKSQNKIVFKNGCLCYCLSADNFNSLRGFSFDWIWVDELTKFRFPTELIQQCFLSLRIGESRMIITTTPRDLPILQNIKNDAQTFVTNGTSYENIELSANFFTNIEPLVSTSFGLQEIQGKFCEEGLWISNDIAYESPSSYDSYRMGIDPAVEGGVTGIILAGCIKDKFYILDDFSQRGAPETWLRTVRTVAQIYPLEIIVETNQGGKLLSTLMNVFQIEASVLCFKTFASKPERRLLTYNLYRQKRVFHAKKMPFLEEEMLYRPKDRVDALYWTLYSPPLPVVHTI